jgi:protoporphyrinogen oxidase
MTGLSAAYASGIEVYEASDGPGGICSSYYLRPGETRRMSFPPQDDEVYRFEIGGGHWIFGDDPVLLHFITNLVSLKRYLRRSAIYFPTENQFIPYPIQNHLRFLSPDKAAKVLEEISANPSSFTTMAQWLEVSFGSTLCKHFFFPFHQLYTAGLYHRIAPQDAYKSPIDLASIKAGARTDIKPVGYNTTFSYPVHGLDRLINRMADSCHIHYGKKVTAIDPIAKFVGFSDGTQQPYRHLISTLPLNRMIQMTGLETEFEPDPFTSVLVINIGAHVGPNCPKEHWLYVPTSKSGFHRVGFYSNVDASFLPVSSRQTRDRVAIYVEKAFPGGDSPSKSEISKYASLVVDELQGWNIIGGVEILDSTWIDVAYTWSWPDSPWIQESISKLKKNHIYQIGRYGKWQFQGIADSIRDGLSAHTLLKD